MNIGKCEFPDFTPIVTLQKTSLKRHKITWLIRLSEHSFWNLSCISLCFRIWIEEGYGNPPWQMDARIGLSYILTSLLFANCLQTFMANSSSFVYASFFAMQKWFGILQNIQQKFKPSAIIVRRLSELQWQQDRL